MPRPHPAFTLQYKASDNGKVKAGGGRNAASQKTKKQTGKTSVLQEEQRQS
jgi:hypothetical protein